jgi:hypothetical protein
MNSVSVECLTDISGCLHQVVLSVDANEFISVHAVDHTNEGRIIEMPTVTFTSIMQSSAMRVVSQQQMDAPAAKFKFGDHRTKKQQHLDFDKENAKGNRTPDSQSSIYQKLSTPRAGGFQSPRRAFLDLPVEQDQEVILSEHRKLTLEQLQELVNVTVATAEEDLTVISEQEALAHDMERIAKYGSMFSTLATGALLWNDHCKVTVVLCICSCTSHALFIGHPRRSLSPIDGRRLRDVGSTS